MQSNPSHYKELSLYLCLAFGITWLLGFSLAYAQIHQLLTQSEIDLLHPLAAAGPAIGALFVQLRTKEPGSMKKWWKQRMQFKTDALSLFIVLSPLLLFAIGWATFAVTQHHQLHLTAFFEAQFQSSTSIASFTLPLLSYAILEEIGWRGYVLPLFQRNWNAFQSTVILSVIWAIWHLPFFFYRFDFSAGIAVGFFFGLFTGALLLTGIYNGSKGSLLPVMVFHFLNNLCSAPDTQWIAPILSVGFVIMAIWVIWRKGYKTLSNSAIPQQE